MASLTTLYDEMNAFLADELVLSMKIHNLHWNIKGPNFFSLHPLMDEYYDAHQERIDETAERLLAIGGQPIGSYAKALELTTIKEREDKKEDGKTMIQTIVTDYAQARNHAKQLIEVADGADDPGTADYFTRVIQDYEKQLWMLNSYLDAQN